MSAQLSLLADKRRPAKRSIQALHLPPVADVTDPQFGPDEIPPGPGLDSPGSLYLVGIERETWEVVSTGDVYGGGVRTPRGVIGAREATREMIRRGARLMRLVRAHGMPTLTRADERSPLLEEAVQAERRSA